MRLRRRFAELALVLALAGCATHRAPPPRGMALAPKIGKPYQVYGVTYYPADDRTYDQTGIASWYGPGFHALSTANGERYDQDGLTAAHKTLPLPSWVEVENRDNGRKLVVRINDRGPFVAGRIIDLSRKAAQLLAVDRPGTAHVRVRRVFPDAAALPPPPPPVIAAAPPPPAGTIQFIQVAALADPGRIAWLSGYLASFGSVVTETTAAGLTRIRLGPYADADPANSTLAKLRAAGYSDARLVPAPTKP